MFGETRTRGKRRQTRILYNQLTGDRLEKTLYPEPTTQQGRMTTKIKRKEACIYKEARNWRRSESIGSQADSGMVHGVKNTQAGLCSKGVNFAAIFQQGQCLWRSVSLSVLQKSMSQNPRKRSGFLTSRLHGTKMSHPGKTTVKV